MRGGGGEEENTHAHTQMTHARARKGLGAGSGVGAGRAWRPHCVIRVVTRRRERKDLVPLGSAAAAHLRDVKPKLLFGWWHKGRPLLGLKLQAPERHRDFEGEWVCE